MDYALKLTGKKQLDVANWVVEAYDGADLEELEIAEAPVLDNSTLSFNEDAVEDVLYRLEEQLVGMESGCIDGEQKDAAAAVRAAKTLAKKIRALTGRED